MATFNYLNNNFTSGQLSPLLSRRSDLQRRQNGASILQNVRVIPQGGVSRREGTIYQAEVKDSSAVTHLIPFKFSTDDNYILEFGNQYMRVYKNDGGLVLESDITITGITQANPAVVTTSGSHGLSNGDQVYITEVVGMTEINDSMLYYTVANVTATTFEVQDRDGNNIDSSAFTAYSSGGVINKIFTLTTPYVTVDIPKLQYSQLATTLTITHPNYAPRDLTRTGDTAWSLTGLMKDTDDASATLLFNDGPYLKENTEPTTLTPSGGSYAPGDTPTITASSTDNINSGDGFQTTDVGRLLRIYTGSEWAWGEITARSSTTVVTVTVKGTVDFPSTAQTRWRLGAWSETTGFPRASTYYQQRHYYASTNDQESTFWGSAINDFVDFSPGTAADNEALNYTLNANGVYKVYWLEGSSKRLRIGTEDGVWSAWSGSTTSTITPTQIQVDFDVDIKCKEVRPIPNGNATLFLERSGKRLREASYSFESDRLIARDVTILSENILGDIGDITDLGATRMTFVKEHYPIIYIVKDDGKLASLTYSVNEDVVAWSDNVIGGTSVAVESVASIPSTEQDIVWVIVKRTINGTTRRFVEKLDTVYRNRNVDDSIFVDSAITVVGEKPAATLTPGATSGTGVTFTAGSSVFSSTDVGRVIESNGSKAEIKTYVSGTEVTADITTNFTSTSAIASGSWNLSINSIDGLEYLEGESVQLLANGGNPPNVTVSNGSITLDGQYNKVTLGLSYNSDIQLIDIDPSSDIGTAFSQRGKIVEAGIEYFETVGIDHGQLNTDTKLETVFFRLGTDNLGEGTPATSGFKRIFPRGGWDDRLTLFLRQNQPLPLTIKSITLKGRVNE